MLQNFCQYITDKSLFLPSDKIVLAVSGGMDSIAMCHLFHLAKYSFAIAHCNFQLRGDESNEDELFVKKLTEKYQVPFFVKHFQTTDYAQDKKISIQMAARDLRYAWFEELLENENYNFIATAHHQNDVVETILLNITKGTGIHGLHGILPSVGKVIRPLLFAKREQIKNYVDTEHLLWREDSSNDSIKYQRNLIRHEVIPLLKKINPNLEETMEQSIEKISAVERIFDLKVEEVKKKAFRKGEGFISININTIKSEPEYGIILFQLLKPFGFNYEETTRLLYISDIGKRIESSSHIVVKDRENFIITEKETALLDCITINQDQKELHINGMKLLFSITEKQQFEMIPSSAETAFLDYKKVQFPLKLRKWKKGDFFYPLGMKQRKKISDLLIDSKIPFNLKEKVKVLESGDEIVWVLGLRIDERFKVSEQTEKILVVKRENI